MTMVPIKSSLTAIVERLKPKAKQPSKADHDWINVAQAVGEISEAFELPSEVAQATLFGLIANGDIWACDTKDLINIDRCTIAEFRPALVEASDLRNWLRENSKVPLSSDQREAAIADKLRSGAVPGRTIAWEKFCDDVRDQCGGWLGKGAKRRPAQGFGDKQIQRAVKTLKER